MSMRPQHIPDIPKETVQVARAAFPKGSIYMQIRDTLGSIYEDEAFVELFSQRGQSAESPWRLALRKCDAICRKSIRPTSRRSSTRPY